MTCSRCGCTDAKPCLHPDGKACWRAPLKPGGKVLCSYCQAFVPPRITPEVPPSEARHR